MTLHHCERYSARDALADELTTRGWTVHGRREDKSDIMTDYFQPADWHGGAAQLDVNGETVWATTDHLYVGIDRIPVPEAVVAAHKEWQRTQRRDNWAVFTADGQLLAHGPGLYRRCEGTGTNGRSAEAARGVAERIDRAARALKHAVTASAGDGAAANTACAPRVRPSRVRDGHVELVFPAKPSDTVRGTLKAAGFRWSGGNGCWYGPGAKLPAMFNGAATETAPPELGDGVTYQSNEPVSHSGQIVAAINARWSNNSDNTAADQTRTCVAVVWLDGTVTALRADGLTRDDGNGAPWVTMTRGETLNESILSLLLEPMSALNTFPEPVL